MHHYHLIAHSLQKEQRYGRNSDNVTTKF